jgi:hypothetical protein
MAQRIAGLSEDWLAVAVGFVIFFLSVGTLIGLDLLGFAAAPKTWIELGKAVQPVSDAYASLGAWGSLLITFGFVLVLMLLAAMALGVDVGKFALRFTVIFWLSYLCWVLGNYAYIAATTPADLEKFGIGWSLKLTGESGYLIALLLGLLIANAVPKLANWLKEAARPEFFIKTAIVVRHARHQGSRAAWARFLGRVPRPRRHNRGLSHLLGGRLFRGAQMVRLQP